MKAKRIPVFYIFLLVLVVLTLILTECGKSYLTDVLREYEDSQYKYVAEEILESHFNSGDGEALYELFSSQISEMETPERASAYFNELIGGKEFSLQSTSTGLDKRIEYAVKCDNKRFATLTLDKSGQTTEKGFALYELKDARLSENLFIERSIKVPLGYTVTVNGIAAGEEYTGGDIITTAIGDDIPGNLLGIHYTTYNFDKLLCEPDFIVTSPAGTPAKITETESGIYAELVFDTTIPDDLREYVIDATEAYACYLQKDAVFGKVAKYLDPDSQLYQSIRTSPNWMVISHNSYLFEDAEVTEYYEYNENAFSCRVTLTHVLKYRGLQDYRDYIDITWYLTKKDGKYLIYDSFNNN